MPISRRAPKPDIRSIRIDTSAPVTPEQPNPTAEPAHSDSPTQHDTKREFKRIALCSLPLIALLFLGYYLDTTYQWVIPFAERLLKLGA
jgi:hypothetical protein